MKTLNWRRRKTPITLDAMLKAQQRYAVPHLRLLVTDEQKEYIYRLLQMQVRCKGDIPHGPLTKDVKWFGMEIVTP